MQRQPIAQVTHDIVPVSPEADDDSRAPVREHPHGHGALGRERGGAPDQIDGGERARWRWRRRWSRGRSWRHGGGEDLQEGVEVLGLVVEAVGGGVHFGEVAGEEGALAVQLLGDDVAVDAAEEEVFGFGEEVFGGVPGGEGGGGGGFEGFGVVAVFDGVDGVGGGGGGRGEDGAFDLGDLVILLGVVGWWGTASMLRERSAWVGWPR